MDIPHEDALVDGWIDVHAHFFPPESQSVRRDRVQALQRAGWRINDIPEWTPEDTLFYMDRTGIRMQLLSYVPPDAAQLRDANDYGAALLGKYPDRFGFLAALPTDDPAACLAEIARVPNELAADGFAVQCIYHDVTLGDVRLELVWRELNRRGATVFVHPNAYGSDLGRPSALVEAPAQTTRTMVDLLYAGIFDRYPDISFVVAHCGGGLPALSGRLALLGAEPWIPNANRLTREDIVDQLGRLYLDTAAAMPTALAPALMMTGIQHLVYGSDCGVPCTTAATMHANLVALLSFPDLNADDKHNIGRNALKLFPSVAIRVAAAP